MYWRMFSDEFGELGQPPERYWNPVLAHHFHLRPADIGDLTPHQLLACALALDTND